MKVLQLFYTSCEQGLSPGKGFQTYAMSEGLTETERHEIERYGVYAPPHNLPYQPTEEEINTRFPVALTFFQLSSGRYGICQTKYIGQDYAGRYGNYFCHALILEAGEWPFYPIQLWESEIFRVGLTEEEANVNDRPLPLPVLEITEVQQSLNKKISLNKIPRFLRPEKSRDVLPNMLTALVDYEHAQRRFILCDSDKHIPYWIAALSMAFPLKLAHALSFTTYTHNPEDTLLRLCSTQPHGTRFAFSHIQWFFSFYVFDLIENKSSQVDNRYEFNQFVKVSYSSAKENLKAFHTFLDLLGFQKINPQIETAYHLFLISCSRIEDLNNDSIIAALGLANAIAPAELLNHLSGYLERIRAAITEPVNLKRAKIVTRFLFKVALQTANNQHFDTAYDFFFQALDHLIVDGSLSVQQALKFNNTIRTSGANPQVFVTRSLEPNRLNTLAQNCVDTPKRAEIYFQITVTNLLAAGFTWAQSIAYAHLDEFFSQCFESLFNAKECFCDTLTTAHQNEELFVQLLSLAITQAAEQTDHIAMILDCLKAIVPENEALPIRTHLLELEQDAFVYQEFLQLLALAINKPAFFWDYHDTIFSIWPAFSDHYFSQAVAAYLENLSSKQQTKEYPKLLSCASNITDNAVLTQVIQHIEEKLPLSAPDSKHQQNILSLSDLKMARNISTSPDITRLAMLAMNIETFASLSEVLASAQPNFVGVDIDRYEHYLGWILPALFYFQPTPDEHNLILTWLIMEDSDFQTTLMSAYTDNLARFLNANKTLSHQVLTDFLIYYFTVMPQPDSPLASWRLPLWDNVVDLLARLSPFDFNDQFFKEIRKKIKVPEERKHLTLLLADVVEKHSFSVTGLFRSFLDKVH